MKQKESKKLSFGLCSRGKASASETERDAVLITLAPHRPNSIASIPSSFSINHLYLIPSASIFLTTGLEYEPSFNYGTNTAGISLYRNSLYGNLYLITVSPCIVTCMTTIFLSTNPYNMHYNTSNMGIAYRRYCMSRDTYKRVIICLMWHINIFYAMTHIARVCT